VSVRIQRSLLADLPDFASEAVVEQREYDSAAPSPILKIEMQEHVLPCRVDVLHTHNCTEIGVCFSGTGRIRFAGTSRLFQPGTVLVIPPGLPHAQEDGEGSRVRWFYLEVDEKRLTAETAERLRPELDELFMQARMLRGLYLDAADQLDALGLMTDRLYRCHEDGLYALEEDGLVRILLSRLAHLPMRALFDEDTERTAQVDPDRAMILPALRCVTERYAQEIDVPDLAAECALSVSHFRKAFGRVMGMPPKEFLNRYRVSRSLFLLRSTDDTVLEIAGRTGFPSIATFNRNFQRYLGCTPGRWRRTVEGQTPVERG